MPGLVLVTYAPRYGLTDEEPERIAVMLGKCGLEVEIQHCDEKDIDHERSN